MRELEEEIEALAVGKEHRRKLKELMNKKELVGDLFNNLRLARQRLNDSARAHSSTLPTPANGSSSATLSSRGSSSSAEETGDSWQVGDQFCSSFRQMQADTERAKMLPLPVCEAIWQQASCRIAHESTERVIAAGH